MKAPRDCAASSTALRQTALLRLARDAQVLVERTPGARSRPACLRRGDDPGDVRGRRDQARHVVAPRVAVGERGDPLAASDVERLTTRPTDPAALEIDVLEEVDRLPLMARIAADMPAALVGLPIQRAIPTPETVGTPTRRINPVDRGPVRRRSASGMWAPRACHTHRRPRRPRRPRSRLRLDSEPRKNTRRRRRPAAHEPSGPRGRRRPCRSPTPRSPA